MHAYTLSILSQSNHRCYGGKDAKRKELLTRRGAATMHERVSCLARFHHRKWAIRKCILEKDQKALLRESAGWVCGEANQVSLDKMESYQT